MVCSRLAWLILSSVNISVALLYLPTFITTMFTPTFFSASFTYIICPPSPFQSMVPCGFRYILSARETI